MTRRLGYWLIERVLRRAFRRIEWHGDPPVIDPTKPVVVYANHHGFHDGHILGWWLERRRSRHVRVWMELYHRFPFFGITGAMPFPNEGARRVRTIRETARGMTHRPDTALLYFPEGRLHPADDGIAWFDSEPFARFDRIFPEKLWWPIAIRVGGWHDAHPTAMLAGGPLHPTTTGREHRTLNELLNRLAQCRPGTGMTVLEGRVNPQDRWNWPDKYQRRHSR